MFTDTNRYLQPSNAFVKYWMRFNNAKAQGLHDANWRGATENFNYFGGVVYKQMVEQVQSILEVMDV